ncbi:MAG: hypothetical protein KDJ23_09630, partial [Rhodoblastus sp.]|nr:hypothetical protein [Rhodoblastus sp.]
RVGHTGGEWNAVMPKLVVALLLLSLPIAAHAAPADPRCARDMQRAGELVTAVAGRDRGGPYGPDAICRVLRANLRDMGEATDIMKRCMSGHALRENVGQMEASMEDVRAVVARKCR